jgi:hypothetical protein
MPTEYDWIYSILLIRNDFTQIQQSVKKNSDLSNLSLSKMIRKLIQLKVNFQNQRAMVEQLYSISTEIVQTFSPHITQDQMLDLYLPDQLKFSFEIVVQYFQSIKYLFDFDSTQLSSKETYDKVLTFITQIRSLIETFIPLFSSENSSLDFNKLSLNSLFESLDSQIQQFSTNLYSLINHFGWFESNNLYDCLRTLDHFIQYIVKQ